MDSNLQPPVSEATALPTEPQPLPRSIKIVNVCLFFCRWPAIIFRLMMFKAYLVCAA